jgi:hypothetical protein
VHVTARVDYTLQAMVALAGSDAAPLPTNALADRLDLSARSVLTGAHPMAGQRSPCQLAVAAGFEPAEGCPSRAFEFCGWWFRPVRLGLVAPEPRLDSPVRTPLNLRE